MKALYGLNQIKKYRKPVVALGVFDGVHRGHRNILKAAVKKAHSIKGTSVVLTFWPHPQREESLYSLEHRLRLIEELGIDVCIVINFNQNFANISAVDFIKDILVKKAGADYIYVGRNFRFGKDAEGNFKTLDILSHIYNFKLKLFDVIRIKPVRNTTQIDRKAIVSTGVNNKPISSTYIRNLIKKGKLEAAQKLLTRPVSILGTVIKGSSLAKQLGFPTANINPHHEVIPPSGVYAVRVIFQGKKFNGICYIGIKPTIKAPDARRQAPEKKYIEVHIFNFNKNIYEKYLEIQFCKKIRDEKKFVSTSFLTQQVQRDIKTTCRMFSRH